MAHRNPPKPLLVNLFPLGTITVALAAPYASNRIKPHQAQCPTALSRGTIPGPVASHQRSEPVRRNGLNISQPTLRIHPIWCTLQVFEGRCKHPTEPLGRSCLMQELATSPYLCPNRGPSSPTREHDENPTQAPSRSGKEKFVSGVGTSTLPPRCASSSGASPPVEGGSGC